MRCEFHCVTEGNGARTDCCVPKIRITYAFAGSMNRALPVNSTSLGNVRMLRTTTQTDENQTEAVHCSAYRIHKESALTEAGNSLLLCSIFHRLVVNFGLWVLLLQVIRHSSLTQLAQTFGACT